jgi:hypothetical protein
MPLLGMEHAMSTISKAFEKPVTLAALTLRVLVFCLIWET